MTTKWHSRSKYAEAEDLFLLTVRSGRRVAIPREDLQDVAEMTREQAAKVSLAERGVVVEWQEENVDFGVKGLADGLWGNERWMQQLDARRRELLKKSS